MTGFGLLGERFLTIAALADKGLILYNIYVCTANALVTFFCNLD